MISMHISASVCNFSVEGLVQALLILVLWRLDAAVAAGSAGHQSAAQMDAYPI